MNELIDLIGKNIYVFQSLYNIENKDIKVAIPKYLVDAIKYSINNKNLFDSGNILTIYGCNINYNWNDKIVIYVEDFKILKIEPIIITYKY